MKLSTAAIAFAIWGMMTMSAIAQPKIEKTTIPNTSPVSGEEMYTSYCAVCHGTSGKGDGPAVSALAKKPVDLTQLSAKNGGKFPQARVIQYIGGNETVAAHGTREMPIWGPLFKSVSRGDAVVQLRMSNLADYVKTLQAK